jgi:hypothetical protein
VKQSSRDIAFALCQSILDLIEESGATQVEALSALGAVQALVPTLPIPATSGADAELGPALPETS